MALPPSLFNLRGGNLSSLAEAASVTGDGAGVSQPGGKLACLAHCGLRKAMTFSAGDWG